MYTRKECHNVEAIRRRVRWLDAVLSTKTNHYNAQERRALRWALAEIEKARGPLPAENEPTSEESKGSEET
jgi:hypothetical protein